MYVYQIIDNKLVSKGKTNFTEIGIIENFKEGYNSYELAYITEDGLQVKLPNNEYKYYIEDDELKEVEFDKEAHNLELKKQELLKTINPLRDEKLSIGFEYKGSHIQADDTSKSNLMGYLLMQDVLVFPFAWRTYENTTITIGSAQELQQLAGLMSDFILKTFQWSWEEKDRIRNAKNIDEL